MIVGVTGLAGSGKDTVSDYLSTQAFVKIGFADPVKRIVMEVYDFSVDQLWGPSENRNAPDFRYPRYHGPWVAGLCACCGYAPLAKPDGSQCYLTPRFSLQTLGTEWGRGCYDDTWVAKGIRTARLLLRGGYQYYPEHGPAQNPDAPLPSGVVISDLRFKNEMRHVKHKGGGLTIRVKRSGSAQTQNASHASEAEQLEVPDAYFDAVIENNGTLAALYEKVDLVMEKFKCLK